MVDQIAMRCKSSRRSRAVEVEVDPSAENGVRHVQGVTVVRILDQALEQEVVGVGSITERSPFEIVVGSPVKKLLAVGR